MTAQRYSVVPRRPATSFDLSVRRQHKAIDGVIDPSYKDPTVGIVNAQVSSPAISHSAHGYRVEPDFREVTAVRCIREFEPQIFHTNLLNTAFCMENHRLPFKPHIGSQRSIELDPTLTARNLRNATTERLTQATIEFTDGARIFRVQVRRQRVAARVRHRQPNVVADLKRLGTGDH